MRFVVEVRVLDVTSKNHPGAFYENYLEVNCTLVTLTLILAI